MSKYNLAVVGATGAVGQEIIEILEERKFPVDNLKLIASKKSEGKKITFLNRKIKVESIENGIFEDIDIALFSIDSNLSKKYAPQAVKEGAVVIDNSNAFRMDDSVPLVVPEINANKINEHQGIIANPNCSTIQLVMAIKPIFKKYGLKRVIVNTYQAVSGTGKRAISELEQQIKDYIDKNEIKSEVYPYQIAFNLLPHIDEFQENKYTKEEMKVVKETRKILDDKEIPITATAVRVPVFNGHGESVNIETEVSYLIDDIKNSIDKMENVKLVDNINENKYPMPIMVENEDEVMVGRIRRDYSKKNALNMWIVANNLRKGAALNAVQIAEKMI
ncbi:MAG TPA: aspartate-semialdehyde dehydrogenase [Halanaerobiales bacterium]|nr:aspartate-semialdehyde dehydrogenase [Halanaerobiales bacterium]